MVPCSSDWWKFLKTSSMLDLGSLPLQAIACDIKDKLISIKIQGDRSILVVNIKGIKTAISIV